MFFTSDPYRAAQTTRMNNVIELHQQSVGRHAHAQQQSENAHRRAVRSLEEEIEEVHRYRARVVAERNALRDQLAAAQRTNRSQAQALLLAFRKIEAQRQGLAHLHTQWAPAHDSSDPLKTEGQIVAFIEQARAALVHDEPWRQGALRDIDELCARIAQNGPNPRSNK